MTCRRGADDRGSVLPLVVGVVVLVVSLVAVTTDAAVLWRDRRALQATVDGAALAGSQALDLGAVYADGAHGDLPLDPVGARTAVRRYVRRLPSAHHLASLRVTSVSVSGVTVAVRAQCVAHPPFLAWVTGGGVTVVAQAAASTRAP